MKHFFFISLVIFFTTSASAQKIRYGLTAGINTGYLVVKDGFDESGGNATGFQAGAMMQIPVAAHLSIMPQLVYVKRHGAVYNFRFDQRNLELPVSVVYTDKNFYIGAGAGISLGLSAKSVMKDNANYSEVDLYDKENDFLLLKRSKFTLNATMGYTFPGGFSLNAGFSPVLGNIRGDGAMNNTISSKLFSFSLGYVFP